MEKRPTEEVKQSPPSEAQSATSGSSLPVEENTERPKKARRTFLTQNACTRCRQKKSKCDGKRPTCGRCEKHAAECTYDVAQEGITRMQHLQQQIENKNQNLTRLMDLFNALQSGTDHEATTLLARLRLGESIDELLSSVQPPQPSSSEARSTESLQSPIDSDSFPPSPARESSMTSFSSHNNPSDSRSLSRSSESHQNRTSELISSHRHTDSSLTVRGDPRSHQRHMSNQFAFQSPIRFGPDPGGSLNPAQWPQPLSKGSLDDTNSFVGNTQPNKPLFQQSGYPDVFLNGQIPYPQPRHPHRRGTEPTLPIDGRPWFPLPTESEDVNPGTGGGQGSGPQG